LDNNLIKFLLGEVKVADLGGGNIVSAEHCTDTWWQIILAHDGEEIFRLNYNPKTKQNENKAPPKNTGGRKSYAMLMMEEFDRIIKADIPYKLETVGFVAYMSRFAEWGTGKIVKKRTKQPIKYEEMLEILSLGHKKLSDIITNLRSLDLLKHTSEGYFISPNIVKKGKTIKKEADRDGR
jgi:hypothetical protein